MLTVYYDGACPLCRTEIEFYRRRDRDGLLRWIDVSTEAPDLPAGLNQDRALARFHVSTAEGELLSGAAAFIEVWRLLPGFRTLARVGGIPPMTRGLEAAYGLFLRLRPFIARRVAGCDAANTCSPKPTAKT